MDGNGDDDDMHNVGYYFDEAVEEEFGAGHSRPSSEVGDSDNPFAEVAATIGVELGGEIAVGHFGRVFRGSLLASDGISRLDVCAKFLKPQQSPKAQRQQIINFQREVTLMSNLNHPNILDLICFVHMPMMCIVTPFMSGGSLFERIHVAGQLTGDSEQLRVALEVSSAMAYLHSLQPAVIHRDLTSANVLFDANNTCKLADFGLAKIKDPLLEPSGQRGNLGWMAPEAMYQSAFEPSSDVYSFGIILWELRARLVPFAGCSPAEIRRQKLSGQWPPPSSLPPVGRSPAGDALREILLHCVQQAPESRPTFQDIELHLNALQL